MKRRGIGFGTALTILFIILKLTGAISWSWWWVLAPTWLPWALAGILLAAAAVLTAIGNGIEDIKASTPRAKERAMYAKMSERASRESFSAYIKGKERIGLAGFDQTNGRTWTPRPTAHR